MTRGRAVAVATTIATLLATVACGTLDRDVILEKPDLDAAVQVEEAGRVDPAVLDAAPEPAPSATAPACEHEDGGCPGPVHCQVHDCSLACPLGCTGTINGSTYGDHARSHRRLPPQKDPP
ncbi:MAG TPA: hypothetical protein VH062_18755 [Polyangiaceae bacterium]|jgi:hypothetical protein|nr:hypothetical protein [Polyangiaceae bacterium]